MKVAKKILKIALIIVGVILAAVLIYIAYVQIQYYRIEDNFPLEIVNPQPEKLKTAQEYSAVTNNIGFGAYNHDFSFFLDMGIMEDGTPTTGKQGRASNKDVVIEDTANAIKQLTELNADFYLLQEVDTDSTRSFHINQANEITSAFPSHSSSFAVNFHSAFLFYPLLDPHGLSNAGLLTLSNKASEPTALRRSYPVDNSFFNKFFDLDRCFSETRFPVEGAKELVIINSHLSAYDKGGTIRALQLKMLNDVMNEEYQKGNYIVIGGDFNHTLNIAFDAFESKQKTPEWLFALTDEDLAKNFKIVSADNANEVPTCRAADIPYTKGYTYTTVVDGFIVSDNIIAKTENIDSDFIYSDHNPVKLTFSLKA